MVRHWPIGLSFCYSLVEDTNFSCDDAMSRFIGSREREKRETCVSMYPSDAWSRAVAGNTVVIHRFSESL